MTVKVQVSGAFGVVQYRTASLVDSLSFVWEALFQHRDAMMELNAKVVSRKWMPA